MDRREFMKLGALSGGVIACLRSGRLLAAERAAVDLYAEHGLQYNIFNALEYGLKADGETDNAAALEELFQRATDEQGRGRPIFFFPAGRYLLGDKVRWDTHSKMGDRDKGYNYGNLFVGMGPTLSQFVLKSNAPGFDDPEHPKQMFGRTGTKRETVGYIMDGLGFVANEDGTNPGSIALFWQPHFGICRNILASGGYAGLHMLRPKGQNATMENITCEGGLYGLWINGDAFNFKHLTCTGFTRAGVRVTREPTHFRGTSTSLLNFSSRGNGPAVHVERMCAVTIIGGRMEADPAGAELAVNDTVGGSTLINVETRGYRNIINGVPAEGDGLNSVSFFARSIDTLTKTESKRW